jgi:ABC-type nitrate/sulfonate/bicarbonate transport system substrate-binding protein
MHQIDGYIGALETGYALEELKEWRVITAATPFVDHFITHVIFARDEMIEQHPELVGAFLAGWFETIAFIKANRDKAVEISAKVINVSPALAARAYDDQIGSFSTDGTFDAAAIATLKKSFIDMHLLKEIPDDKALFTTRFVPVKVDQ